MTENAILVFRFGSIGDFVVSLPCFHLIRRRFPRNKIVLLTNEPAPNVVGGETILEGTGLVDQFLTYPGGTREFVQLKDLKRQVQILAPKVFVYLAPQRKFSVVIRDYVFFRWCGLHHSLGFPTMANCIRSTGFNFRESEAQRLGRRLAKLGSIDIDDKINWDLHLSGSELHDAKRILIDRFGALDNRVIGLSVGTKRPINDWGDANWHSVLEGLGNFGFRLVLIGGENDRARSEKLAKKWPGPTLNLCGKISPRVSAAVLKHLRLFLCHDSGPMHLAAAVGTRCVAVFSRQNPPGKWFPNGAFHQVLYPTAKNGTI